MIHSERKTEYREDINGLRAIAVLTVILVHFKYLPKGFLGVDIFFVISGFLITAIIYEEILNKSFSLTAFYLRRVRRIMPLALFACLIALPVAAITMLPDDLQNFAQSVIATNFFSNNIIQAVTTRGFWDVVNDFKPLTHTWSLGVEEQYYLVYPLLLLLLANKKQKFVLISLAILAALSLGLYLSADVARHYKFYLILFRFWELAVGGIIAIGLRGQLFRHRYGFLLILALLAAICLDLPFISASLNLILVVLLTAAIICSDNKNCPVSSFILGNRISSGIGKISFSLYIWHQMILAFTRYFVVAEPGHQQLIAVFTLSILLSVFSYFFIEKPFRDPKRVSNRFLLISLSLTFSFTTLAALFIYSKGGIIRDIPELEISKANIKRNMQASYNARIYKYDKDFSSTDKIRILVIGDSFARDWANVLEESEDRERLEISYINNPENHAGLVDRAKNAAVIFYALADVSKLNNISLPKEKLWAVGTKRFCISNGIFYNRKGENYFSQRYRLAKDLLEENSSAHALWGNKYINLTDRLIDQNQSVPVFTPARKFISQDCSHFTKAGAQYFAELFKAELKNIFNSRENHREKEN